MLIIERQASQYLFWGLVFLYGLSGSVIVYLALMVHIGWLVILPFIIMDGIYQVRLQARLSHAKSIQHIVYQADNKWQLLGLDSHAATLLSESYASSWLIVLRFKTDNQQPVVILLPDMVTDQTFRQLSLLLNMGEIFEVKESTSFPMNNQ